MAFFFPFSTLHELNLDWVLNQVKKFAELIPPMEEATTNVQTALDDATEAVNKADQALEDAGDALTTAQEAKDIAEQAAQGTIADGAVTTAKIADGAVTGNKIGTSTIQTGNLSSGCVTSTQILDGTIVAADMTDGAVTTAKLADDAVTAAKIDDGAVGSAALAAGAVTNGKIGDGAVTYVKLGTDALISTGSGYIKFPDGTMICYGTHTTVSVEAGGTTNEYANFPQTFYNAPWAIAAAWGTVAPNKFFATARDTTTTQVRIYAYNGHNAASAVSATWLAIGRWKA